jgi:hypothetical protein
MCVLSSPLCFCTCALFACSSAQAQSIGTLFEQIRSRGGSVDMSKSQRHTRSGAGHGSSQANEAAIKPKLTRLCQHEIVSGILKKWKQCGTVQASYGCLVSHVCMGVCISVFAPQLCNTSISGLDEYADRCLFEKGADWYPFCLVWGTGNGVGGGGGAGGSTPKSIRAFQKKAPSCQVLKNC